MRLIKLSAYAGIFGPFFFGTMLTLLTFIKYDFLLSLGWHPLLTPTFDWPSGLALGRLGWLMALTFILSGAAMMVFAVGLDVALSEAKSLETDSKETLRSLRSLRVTRITAKSLGSLLMLLSGLAMMGLAFTADPTIRSTPATWHGRLHDLSFVSLGLTLISAMIFLGFAFRDDEHWKNLSLYTWGTALLALPTFFIKGAAFYVFLFAVLAWSEVIGWRLKNIHH